MPVIEIICDTKAGVLKDTAGIPLGMANSRECLEVRRSETCIVKVTLDPPLSERSYVEVSAKQEGYLNTPPLLSDYAYTTPNGTALIDLQTITPSLDNLLRQPRYRQTGALSLLLQVLVIPDDTAANPQRVLSNWTRCIYRTNLTDPETTEQPGDPYPTARQLWDVINSGGVSWAGGYVPNATTFGNSVMFDGAVVFQTAPTSKSTTAGTSLGDSFLPTVKQSNDLIADALANFEIPIWDGGIVNATTQFKEEVAFDKPPVSTATTGGTDLADNALANATQIRDIIEDVLSRITLTWDGGIVTNDSTFNGAATFNGSATFNRRINAPMGIVTSQDGASQFNDPVIFAGNVGFTAFNPPYFNRCPSLYDDRNGTTLSDNAVGNVMQIKQIITSMGGSSEQWNGGIVENPATFQDLVTFNNKNPEAWVTADGPALGNRQIPTAYQTRQISTGNIQAAIAALLQNDIGIKKNLYRETEPDWPEGWENEMEAFGNQFLNWRQIFAWLDAQGINPAALAAINASLASKLDVNVFKQMVRILCPLMEVKTFWMTPDKLTEGMYFIDDSIVTRADFPEAFALAGVTEESITLTSLASRFVKGYDPSTAEARPLGSYEEDAMQPITGSVGWVKSMQNAQIGSGALQWTQTSDTAIQYLAGAGARDGLNMDSSRVTRTAERTRPENVNLTKAIRLHYPDFLTLTEAH